MRFKREAQGETRDSIDFRQSNVKVDTWYDADSTDKFFTEAGELRNESWEPKQKEASRRCACLGVTLVFLIITTCTAMSAAFDIDRQTAHNFTIGNDTLCVRNSTGLAPDDRSLKHWAGDMNIALDNDKTMMVLASVFLAIAFAIFTVGSLLLAFPYLRFAIEMKGSKWRKAWYLLFFMFGGVSVIIGAFCGTWAGSGYANSFDTDLQCGSNVFLVLKEEQNDLKSRVNTLGILCAWASMGSFVLLVIASFLVFRFSISFDYDVLHWISEVYYEKTIDGPNREGKVAQAPSPSMYAEAVSNVYGGVPGEEEKSTILARVTISGLDKDIYINQPKELSSDPSPNVIAAIRDLPETRAKRLVPSKNEVKLDGIVTSRSKITAAILATMTVLGFDSATYLALVEADQELKDAIEVEMRKNNIKMESRSPLTIAAVSSLFTPRYTRLHNTAL